MSEVTPPPGEPPTPRRPGRIVAALPYIATAVAAILCSSLIQLALLPRLSSAPLAGTTATAPSALPEQTPAPPSPAPSPLPADERVLRLEVLDLEAEDRQLWSALYLLRAASQLDDASVALQVNNLDEVNRILLNARRSLDQAYAFSAEQAKGPIDTFRLQVGQIRDDLYVRPEGLDRRLRQVRQLILSLVDADGV